jgi:hypothetical protein
MPGGRESGREQRNDADGKTRRSASVSVHVEPQRQRVVSLFSIFTWSSIMKHAYNIVAGALLAGAATLASAQSPQAQAFAERFAELQALASNSSQFQREDMPAAKAQATGEDDKPSLAKWWADFFHRPKKS